MTNKREAFCVAYAKSGNATQAAKEAGYSDKTAYSQGQRLLKLVEIQHRLQEIAEETREQREAEYKSKIATAGEIQDFLTKVMRGEITEEVVVTEGIGNGFSESRVIYKAPSIKDRVSAAEKLARMQGLFTDKLQVEGAVPVILCDDIGGDDSER